ncbi:MAG: sigma-70 family RNA polymerase sigma factor [Acidobacteria bacterium]|nr:sigma-70 family RNA polymerase sigma factor [Acidobacteriota bacterium]
MRGNESNQKQRLESFEAQALGFADQLYRVALRLCRNREKAEDLIQETYLQAWRSFHRFEIGTNLRAWLYKIMFNVHYSILRRDKLQLIPTEETIAETLAYDPPTPQRLTEEEVLAALEKLPRDFQIPIMLADVEKLSYREIADVMEIPIGTVMSRLHRGRKILRTELVKYAREAGYKVSN